MRKFLFILGTFILVSCGMMGLLYQEYSKIYNGKFVATFFDVPLGDAILLRTPHGKNIFLDGGIDDAVLAELDRFLPFWQREIELLIITHPDADHLAGGYEVLKKFPVKKVLVSGINNKSTLFQTFLQSVSDENIPLIVADKNTDFWIDGVYFDTLFPNASFVGDYLSSLNNASVVQRITFGNQSLLLTGDIEKNTERELLASSDSLQSAVLKVAHHGSKSSSLESFLQAVAPQAAVILAAKDNRFGHPHDEVVERLNNFNIQKFISRDVGTFSFVFNPDSFFVETNI